MVNIIKRNGKKEAVNVEKIISRIEKQCYNLDSKYIVPFEVAQKVIEGIYDGVSSRQLDELAAETAAALTTKHPDYALLASRLAVSALHKDTKKSFSDTIKELYNHVDKFSSKKTPLIAKDVYDVIMQNAELLDSAIVYNRDFNYDYFGYKALQKSYLLKINGKTVERPQHLIMRVALGIHLNDIESALHTYNLISEGYFTHATPTLFNAGTPRPQMSSCFLLDIIDDSIGGIYQTLGKIAEISKNAGGIGVAVSKIRAKGSHIRGTNGTSNGLVPMLKVFNETARYVDQCFTADTLIDIVDGQKKISEIVPGDLVLTTDGYQVVEEVKTFDIDDKIIQLENNDSKIGVTRKHIFLVAENASEVKDLKQSIKDGLIKLVWKESMNIEETDMLLKIK